MKDLGAGNEGSVTFDGKIVFLNVDPDKAGRASMKSRMAHEFEHGLQVDNGELGFRRPAGEDWRVTFTDIFDEVGAWNAQMRQSAPVDFKLGNVRGYMHATDKPGYLTKHGYPQYRDREGEAHPANAPAVDGYAPGALLRTENWFYRIPR